MKRSNHYRQSSDHLSGILIGGGVGFLLDLLFKFQFDGIFTCLGVMLGMDGILDVDHPLGKRSNSHKDNR